MSGRSAHVRVKKEKVADQNYHQRHYESFLTNDGFNDSRLHTPTPVRRLSFDSQPSSSHANTPSTEQNLYSWNSNSNQHSHGHAYYYRPPAPKQPRPIIIASAIEKSDFRTHLDGMADNVRDKLGRYFGKGKDPRATRPNTASTGFARNSLSIATPSIHEVPSLVHSFPSSNSRVMAQRSSSFQTRPPSDETPPMAIANVFQGGGLVTQNSWKLPVSAPELMDPYGDTLVYLFTNSQNARPSVTLRVNSQVMFDAGCTAFTNQLTEAFSSATRMWRTSGNTDLQSIDCARSQPETVYSADSRREKGERLSSGTMSSSDSPHTPDSAYPSHAQRVPEGVRYKLRIVYPGGQIGLDATTWMQSVRNFLVVLYGADTLSGKTLFDALRVLSQRLREEPNYLDQKTNRTAFIVNFLKRYKFDDVSMNPSNAASILAFSELPEIQWKEGYVEAFIHCVGMFNAGFSSVPEWKLISPRSRIFIENAALDVDPRLRRAQSFLHDFAFADLWPARISSKSAGRAAFDRFRQWLCEYCASRTPVGTWPPPANQKGLWLTREILVMLRDIFISLFDYLVDHDIIFEESEYNSDLKWSLVSKSGQFFRADLHADLPITDMLIAFDDTHSFHHLPSPYPIRPELVPMSAKTKPVAKKPSMSRLEHDANIQRKALTYVEASNLYTTTALSDIIADFNALERQDMIETINPRDARLGRWLLIYCALQVLSTIAVDTPGLRHAGSTSYHLNTTLRGIAPFAEPQDPSRREPSPLLFHPFSAPLTWPHAIPKARPSAYKPIVWGVFGDGRERADLILEQMRAAASSPASPQLGRSVASSPSLAARSLGGVSSGVAVALSSTASVSSASSRYDNGNSLLGTLARSDSKSQRRVGGRGGLAGPTSIGVLERAQTSPQLRGPSLRNEEVSVSSVVKAKLDAEKSRQRRAEVHGFSDYKPEVGW